MKKLLILVLVLAITIPALAQTVSQEPRNRVHTAEMDLVANIGTLASAHATLKMDALYFNSNVPASVLSTLESAMRNPVKDISSQRMQAQQYMAQRDPWYYHKEIVNSPVPLAMTAELKSDIEQATKVNEQYQNLNKLLTLINQKLGEKKSVFRFVSQIVSDYFINNLSSSRYEYWRSNINRY